MFLFSKNSCQKLIWKSEAIINLMTQVNDNMTTSVHNQVSASTTDKSYTVSKQEFFNININ